MFEVNKIHLAIIRIINEYRNNRITVRFVSKDGAKDDSLAEVCSGLFRADEYDSGAEEAYDNAFEEAVGGGFGAFRLRTVYEDEEDPDNEKQRIRIEPIYDADASVFFDLDAKRQDKADAKYCFIVYSMTPDAYREEWDDDPDSWDKEVDQSQFDWATPDLVHVAEYYLKEDHGDTVITYIGVAGDELKVRGSELKRDPTMADDLAARGYNELSRRHIKAAKVHKYILSGGSVLDDCGFVAGKCIPVIPNFGKRWFVDNVERCMGHVRLAKDAQRLSNMQLSKLGEISALSSVAKPIFSPEQMAGHTDQWSQDNIKNYPYLLVNSITGADGNPMPAGPLAYTKPPEIPQALAALITITDTDIKELLGNQPEADKMVSNIADKTLLDMHARLDMQTYIYVSNLAKAIRRAGEVWQSMAREVYVEDGRRMKTVDHADKVDAVTLMAPDKDPKTGALIGKADLTRASFDVNVEVGPSSKSRREATVKSLTGMLQAVQGMQDPDTAAILMSMAIMNMEGEGIGDVREYFRKKLVKMGALKPTDEEAQALAASEAKPSPQDEALMGMAEEAQAKATAARASVLKTMADVEKTHAQTMEILANVDMNTAEKATLLMEKFGAQQEVVPKIEDKGASPPGAVSGGEGASS
jgi:hypothetical protein